MERIAMGAGVILVAVLVSDMPIIQWITAGIVLVGIVPLYRAIRRAEKKRFWEEVEAILASSDEQQQEGLPFAQD